MPINIENIKTVCKEFGFKEIRSAIPLSSGFANQNYKIDTEKGTFLYRICIQQSHIDFIHYEIDLLKALKEKGIPIANMIPKINGGYHTDSTEGKVLIYEFKNGKEPDLNSHTVREIARALSKLNQFGDWKKFIRKNIIHIDYCDELIKKFKDAPCQYPEIYEYFTEQTHYLRSYITQDLPTGLIHGDCFPDNTIFQDDKLVAIIDFEEACVDHLLMEVGMTINGFCFKNNKLDEGLMNEFLKEYNKIRPLTKREWELLPYYIQWGAHGMLSWHLRHNLIYKEDQRQYSRVVELMERVKLLRKSGKPNINN